MAINILATPPDYASVHFDLLYTVEETVHTADPVTYPNYKFIGDVYVGGVLVARVKKVPDPVTKLGIFNIGQIVRNYMATIFNPTPNVLVAMDLGDTLFYLPVVMKFGEEYSYTSYYNLTVDSQRLFFNNYQGRLLDVSSLFRVTDRFATDQYYPTGNILLSSQYLFLSYWQLTASTITITVTPFGGGATFSTTFTPANAFDMMVLNVSPGALNSISPGTINASTVYYDVNISSQTFRFYLICESIYQPYTLHFLNQLGGWDTKIFSKVSRRSMSITKKDFGKLNYTVGSDGIPVYMNANNVVNETKSVYSSQYVERLTLNSDLISDPEYAGLSSLMFSPMVYIEEFGNLYPCVITDSSYDIKKVVTDDLTNLTITIEYGTTNNAQYR